MTTTTLHAELPLMIQLGSSVIAYRPAAHTESSPTPKRLDEDTIIGLTDPCALRIRLQAYDQFGDPVADPAWVVNAATRLGSGMWQLLSDLSPTKGDVLVQEHAITDAPRTYRFSIGLRGSSVAAIYELTIAHHDHDPAANDDDDGDHDILFDPADDLKPPPAPAGSTYVPPRVVLLASG